MAERPREFPLRGVVAVGVAVIVVFFGVFGLWATLAPLKGAAVAHGVVVVDSNRKTVRHLEGGIVKAILVGEGENVRAGEVLVRLDDTRARAKAERLRLQYLAAAARKRRFQAERDAREALEYPDWLLAEAAADSRVHELLASQRQIFRARRAARADERAALEARVERLQEEIAGLGGESEALRSQLALVREQTSDMSDLLERKLVPKPDVLELQRLQAKLAGDLKGNSARIASAGKEIAETRIRIREVDSRRLSEASEGVREAQAEMFDFEQRLREARDVLRRTEIRAPRAGTVVNLRIHTPGGTVKAGQALMDVVPREDRLIVEARIRPEDIDAVRPGLKTQVRLTALSRRHTKPVPGRLASVSADSLEDEQSGEPYFLGRVQLDRDAVARLDGIALHPGMQTEVMIVTAERTFLDYMLEPFLRSLERAFTET